MYGELVLAGGQNVTAFIGSKMMWWKVMSCMETKCSLKNVGVLNVQRANLIELAVHHPTVFGTTGKDQSS